MPVPTDITAGTLTITNGSTAVTGVGTAWLASDLRQGDIILWIEGGDGFQTPILAAVPTSNTALTLVEPWEGPTLTGVRYRIRYQWDSSRVSAQSRQLIEMLDNGNVLTLSGLTGPGVPVFDGPHSMVIKPESDFIDGVAYDVQVNTLADRATYDGQTAGFSVLVSDIGDGRSAIYSKASNSSGDWTDAAYVTGPVGPASTVPGVTWQGTYAGGTAYVANDGVLYNGSSWRAKIATTGNAPPALPTTSNTWWELLAAKGTDGTGTGDVVGPGSSVAGRLPTFLDTTGKLLADGGVLISEALQGSMRNLLINSSFMINQRGYVSATPVGAANTFTFDRWRVVASGQAVTFGAGTSIRPVTCPVSGIAQTIPAAFIQGGTYVLNWAGTAISTVNGASVSKGVPFALANNVNAEVVFAGGTLQTPQLEFSPVASRFELRPPPLELLMCQWFYQEVGGQGTADVLIGGYNGAGGNVYYTLLLPQRMWATPTATKVGTWSVSNFSQPTVSAVSRTALNLVGTTIAAGYGYAYTSATNKVTLEAEVI